MQKPRPKEATAPQRQRSPHDADTSNKGASAPFVIPEGEKVPETPGQKASPDPAINHPSRPEIMTDRNETASRPDSWDEIRVGSLVIAHESPEDGWWEAIVVAIENDQLLLRWRDYPRQPCVRRAAWVSRCCRR